MLSLIKRRAKQLAHARIDKGREFYRITYTDDGQGLSLSRILKKAQELGVAKTDRPYKDQETAELIFHPGLSTASQGNTISGRGVGMDAIRSFLKQEGGNISIKLNEEFRGDLRPFSFLIDIPLPKVDPKPEPLKKIS